MTVVIQNINKDEKKRYILELLDLCEYQSVHYD